MGWHMTNHATNSGSNTRAPSAYVKVWGDGENLVQTTNPDRAWSGVWRRRTESCRGRNPPVEIRGAVRFPRSLACEGEIAPLHVNPTWETSTEPSMLATIKGTLEGKSIPPVVS
jgi:hypothetical protein